jgi:enoyl-CoA hydratase/carnithine racemase
LRGKFTHTGEVARVRYHGGVLFELVECGGAGHFGKVWFMSLYTCILTEQTGCVATVTLNRPLAMNALSETLLQELLQAFNALGADQTVRVIVLAAAGQAFCAGHDLKQMARLPQDQAAYADLFNLCSQVMLVMQKLPQPVIAKVQGLATAAGCQLVANCDLALAADTARFATSGIDYGLFCATPSVPLTRNLPRKQAMHMLLTGDFISADQAEQYGLINQHVPAEDLDSAVQALCERLAEQAPAALALGKRLVYQQAHMSDAAAYQLATQTMALNMSLDCAQSGVARFVNKQTPSTDAH